MVKVLLVYYLHIETRLYLVFQLLVMRRDVLYVVCDPEPPGYRANYCQMKDLIAVRWFSTFGANFLRRTSAIHAGRLRRASFHQLAGPLRPPQGRPDRDPRGEAAELQRPAEVRPRTSPPLLCPSFRNTSSLLSLVLPSAGTSGST